MISVRKAARILRRDGGPDIRVRNPERYLHAHKRRLLAALGTRHFADRLRNALSMGFADKPESR